MEQLSTHWMDFLEVWPFFFFKLLRKLKFHEYIAGITGTLLDDQHPFLIISCTFLPKMRNVSDNNCRENQNTHFVFNNLFFWNLCRLQDNVEKYCGGKQAPYDNRVHDHYILDTQSYEHTLRICNIYCYSSATVFAWICPSATLYVCCPSCKHVK